MAASDISGAEGAEAQETPPLKRIPEPPHISTTAFQESYLDMTSQAPLGRWVKLQEGDNFPDSGVWKQV